MVLKQWNTPVGVATYCLCWPCAVVLDYPNEAGILVVWGLVSLHGKWRWVWNEAF